MNTHHEEEGNDLDRIAGEDQRASRIRDVMPGREATVCDVGRIRGGVLNECL